VGVRDKAVAERGEWRPDTDLTSNVPALVVPIRDPIKDFHTSIHHSRCPCCEEHALQYELLGYSLM
jgi:hypothetical protein